jgi:hypothetical protein
MVIGPTIPKRRLKNMHGTEFDDLNRDTVTNDRRAFIDAGFTAVTLG